jgi:hypothetical protein
MDVLDAYVAQMIEDGEVGFDALLDRPDALRHLSPKTREVLFECLRKYAASLDDRTELNPLRPIEFHSDYEND